MVTKSVYVAWQDPESRSWYPVGKLSRGGFGYCFVYLKGATKSNRFMPFGRMVEMDNAYISDTLFPLFSNRLLPKSRPEYAEYLDWLGLKGVDFDELDLLSLSGGLRTTDSLEMFSCPERNKNNQFDVTFFSHGIRHLSEVDQAKLKELKRGDKLYLMKDFQNPYDSFALLMRTPDPVYLAGYCPRYYASTFCRLLDEVGAQSEVDVVVEKSNPSAPSQFRLQCTITAPWPKSFEPFDGDEFVPLAELPSEIRYEVVSN